MDPVTIVVARRPTPGKEQEMDTFTDEVKQAASQFPGYLESTVCKPDNINDPEYRIVVKFDSLKNYRLWEQSEERKNLSKKGNSITREAPQLQIITGLETWFSLPGSSPIKPPEKYKMMILIWSCLFPLVNLFNWLLTPYLKDWDQLSRTFITTLILVPIMTYITIPIMSKLFTKWLYPDLEDH